MTTETIVPLTVPLYVVQDSAGYHTRNEPGELQRENIIDDLCSGLLLQVGLQGVVHGTLSPGGAPATLLIMRFYFQGRTEKRRFRNAQIKIKFADQQKPLDEDPEVVSLWPQGDFTFDVSDIDISDSKGGEATMNGGLPGFQVGLNGTWTRTTGRKRKDRASMNGARRIEGRDWGKQNVVRIILDENADQKGGIVTTLSVAILLKRKTVDDRFVAQVEVEAEADIRYSAATKIRDLSGKTPVNDPVVFDPKCQPTMVVKDVSNLGAEDLESLAQVISTTVISTVQDVAAAA